ncbi:MAG: ParB/RepB/Spo0J family partition protein [Chloroflexi bacterium]|nr:ParB/RepB/Spo0J family partition protein [Chloroflexota bacterium]
MARRRQLDFGGVAEAVQIGATARAVLHKTVDDGVADLELAKEIRLALIEPDAEQPRKHFDEEGLRELAQSILMQGVLQPIVVEWLPERERFRIISGERRWRAALMAGEMHAADPSLAPGRRDLAAIPAIIRNPSALDRSVQQVYENEQRQDYSDVERAFAYERLKGLLGLTWEDLATRLGLSRGRIHQILRTKNRLAPGVQRDITSGRLTGRHGLYLMPLVEPAQEAVAAAVAAHALTHEQTRAVVQRVRRLMEAAAPAADGPAAGPAAPAGLAAAPSGAPDAAAEGRAEGTTVPSAAYPLGSGLGWAAAGHTIEEATRRADGPAAAGVGLTESGASPTGDGRPPGAVVAQAVAEVLAGQAGGARRRRGEAQRAVALARQLVQLEVAIPAAPAERAALAAALDELLAWAGALRGRLGGQGV